MKSPYDIGVDSLKESRAITEGVEKLKYKLGGKLSKILMSMDREEALQKTGLHKADLSRLICTNYSRFSIDRIIDILIKLGYTPEISITKKKKRVS